MQVELSPPPLMVRNVQISVKSGKYDWENINIGRKYNRRCPKYNERMSQDKTAVKVSKFGMKSMKYVDQHFSGWIKIIILPEVGDVLLERSYRAKHIIISVKPPWKIRLAVSVGIDF